LGFLSRSLRDLYSFQNNHWEALGYKVDTGLIKDKGKIINILKKAGFQDMISDLETFDALGLPNYNFNFISRDEGVADNWFNLENELLNYHGKYYRIPDSSSSFFYCNANFTIEIEVSVDPEGQTIEENNLDFAGRKVFSRDGQMSHDTANALAELQFEKITKDVDSCAPIHFNLKESGLLDYFAVSKILSKEELDKVNTLVIFPNSESFVKKKIGLAVSKSRGSHPLETDINDMLRSNIDSGRKNCTNFEQQLEKFSCKSYEEIARDRSIKNIENSQGVSNNNNDDKLVSGLMNKTASSCSIRLLSGSITLFAPSDAPYQVICRYRITVNKISSFATNQFIWSDGSPGNADDVAEIRISNENITDPDEDSYQTQRPSSFIRPVDSSSTAPLIQAKYVFAGEPQGVVLSPRNGLTNLDINLSSDGFETSVTFSTKTPKPSKANSVVRYVHSQFNRASYNAS
jgi:hypothetical protein